MTNLDCLGNNITNASPQVIAGVNDFINGFLAYEKKAIFRTTNVIVENLTVGLL